ncbi:MULTISPECIES: hemerythrin domain-containing protein [Methanobacterium]|jgi:iron-sulfur cluster repair protein YtfE (RIC family)|uniref:Hemerythrin domain-containing protein n=1 Tax=Methanobacterium veterum TaxID=408577 RepID=A0A9E5DPD5_9EURY|nr:MULTISPECIES: hemerythrin domain-containing protein [Methanobacterium]MCZ3364529.1 hemerythrin domain-containing protein [Methanobacterium veterum]MCZ3372283.1 hemerythrin domain-containing protein [Methanobacterium veterum]
MTHQKLYEMLEHDHEEVKEMFKEAINNEDPSKYKEIKKELEVHMKGEEDFYYPKAKKADKDLVEHGIEEHEEAKSLIKELDRLGKNDGQFMPKLKELKDSVEHHVDEEEHKLFPKSRDTLSDNEEKEIAEKIEEEKSKMM